MKVAILHFHFNRGGVTQVVLNQLRGLDTVVDSSHPLQIALIHGGRRGGMDGQQLSGFRSVDVSMHSVASLDYDDDGAVADEPLARAIRDTLANAGFDADSTLLHIHNHSLGKNVSLPGAVRRLAEDGFRILLQLHDFAEDLRPENYRRLSSTLAPCHGDPSAAVYPQSSHIHYAVLNRRDFVVFQQAGLAASNLHLLPNAAGEFGRLPDKESARRTLQERFGVSPDATYILYPVRGIRRKNVGELLLWSAMAGENSVCAVTLPPLNPVEQTLYAHWKRLAAELELPCVFETGAEGGLDFHENLAASDLLITTSVAEGFGMVFLEAWLAGRNLVGRNLPEITADFLEAGIRFDQLYSQLLVPTRWVGKVELQRSLFKAYMHLLEAYRVDSLATGDVEHQLANLSHAEHVDFAVLDSALQGQVIRTVHTDRAARAEVLRLNPIVGEALGANSPTPAIAENARAVREFYSLAASGDRLWKLYGRVMDSPVGTRVGELPHATRILASFLDVTRMHPIRFERP